MSSICIVNLGCMNGHPVATMAVEAAGARPTDAEIDAWTKELRSETAAEIAAGEIWETCPHCGISLRAHQVTVLGTGARFKTVAEANRWLEEGSKIGIEEAKAAMRKRVN